MFERQSGASARASSAQLVPDIVFLPSLMSNQRLSRWISYQHTCDRLSLLRRPAGRRAVGNDSVISSVVHEPQDRNGVPSVTSQRVRKQSCSLQKMDSSQRFGSNVLISSSYWVLNAIAYHEVNLFSTNGEALRF